MCLSISGDVCPVIKCEHHVDENLRITPSLQRITLMQDTQKCEPHRTEHSSLGNSSSKLHSLFPDWDYLTCHKTRSALISYEYFLGHWCTAPELNATCIPGLSHLLVQPRQERDLFTISVFLTQYTSFLL